MKIASNHYRGKYWKVKLLEEISLFKLDLLEVKYDRDNIEEIDMTEANSESDNLEEILEYLCIE